MTSCITLHVAQHIALLTLNRPLAANAMSRQMLDELLAACELIRHDSEVRAVIVTGAGERVFCAGADLKERQTMSDDEAQKTVAHIGHTIAQLEALPQPVIAAINGAAYGGGLELALACDIRLAAQSATLGLTETALGIIPGAGGTQRLPRLIGAGRAKELIFSAAKIPAHTALTYGIVEHVVADEQLLREAYALAQRIAANAPLAVQQAKKAIHTGLQVDLASGLVIEEQAYAPLLQTADRLEGLQAFQEKRPPLYRGQ